MSVRAGLGALRGSGKQATVSQILTPGPRGEDLQVTRQRVGLGLELCFGNTASAIAAQDCHPFL